MSTLRYKWNATVGNSQEIWNKLKANRCGSFLFIWLNNLSCLTAQVFRAVKPHRTSTFSESRIPRKRVTFFMNDMKLSVFVKGKSICNTGIDCFCETTAIYYFSMELITLSSCWKWTHQVCASCFHLFSFHVYAKSFQIIKNVTHTHTHLPQNYIIYYYRSNMFMNIRLTLRFNQILSMYSAIKRMFVPSWYIQVRTGMVIVRRETLNICFVRKCFLGCIALTFSQLSGRNTPFYYSKE